MKYAWLVLGVFAAHFFATAIAFPQIDGDLSWQRWLGRSIAAAGRIPHALGRETFSAPGSRWVPQEWSFSLAASAATPGLAWDVFAGAVALCAILALGIASFHAVRRGASPRAVVVCTSLAGIALFESFGVRVQVVAWPLLALFVLLLDCDGPWAYAAIPVVALWSNVHGSVMLAPILATIAAAGTAIDERGVTPRVRRAIVVALGSALALGCNPFGWDLARYALALFASPIKEQIVEWAPTTLADPSFAFGALPLLVLALVFFADGTTRRVRDALLLGTFAFLVLAAGRNIALFGIVALPLVAPALTRGVRWLGPETAAPDPRAERIARVALPAFGAALAVVVAFGLLHSAARTKDDLAFRAVASVAALPGERRLFCADFAWCGLAVGQPHVSVFLDGRADPYPVAVWRDFDRIAGLEHDWRATLERYAVDTVVVGRGAPLDQAIGDARLWRVTYADATYRVWARLRGNGRV